MGAVRRVRGGGGGGGGDLQFYRAQVYFGAVQNIRNQNDYRQNQARGTALRTWATNGAGTLRPTISGNGDAATIPAGADGRYGFWGNFRVQVQKNIAGATEPFIMGNRRRGAAYREFTIRNHATRSISVNAFYDEIHVFGTANLIAGDVLTLNGERDNNNVTAFILREGSVLLVRLGPA